MQENVHCFFVVSHTLPKFQAFPKLITQFFLSRILFYFAGMIFFCSFTSPIEDDKGNKHTSIMTFVKQ